MKAITGRLKFQRGSENLFRDFGFTAGNAGVLLLKAQLMSAVRQVARSMTTARASKRFGVTRPKINSVLGGRIDEFSLDALVGMLARGGLNVDVKIQRAA